MAYLDFVLTDAVNSALRHGFGSVSVLLTTALISFESEETPEFATTKPTTVSKNFIL